eukprot:m.73168 g.73168  ORF g.73168 m.73168 type:complete len:358 (+) comp8412_c1_seq7:135-1208(+)
MSDFWRDFHALIEKVKEEKDRNGGRIIYRKKIAEKLVYLFTSYIRIQIHGTHAEILEWACTRVWIIFEESKIHTELFDGPSLKYLQRCLNLCEAMIDSPEMLTMCVREARKQMWQGDKGLYSSHSLVNNDIVLNNIFKDLAGLHGQGNWSPPPINEECYQNRRRKHREHQDEHKNIGSKIKSMLPTIGKGFVKRIMRHKDTQVEKEEDKEEVHNQSKSKGQVHEQGEAPQEPNSNDGMESKRDQSFGEFQVVHIDDAPITVVKKRVKIKKRSSMKQPEGAIPNDEDDHPALDIMIEHEEETMDNSATKSNSTSHDIEERENEKESWKDKENNEESGEETQKEGEKEEEEEEVCSCFG